MCEDSLVIATRLGVLNELKKTVFTADEERVFISTFKVCSCHDTVSRYIVPTYCHDNVSGKYVTAHCCHETVS